MSKDRRRQVRFDDELDARLMTIAEENGEPVSIIIRRAVRHWLDRAGTK